MAFTVTVLTHAIPVAAFAVGASLNAVAGISTGAYHFYDKRRPNRANLARANAAATQSQLDREVIARLSRDNDRLKSELRASDDRLRALKRQNAAVARRISSRVKQSAAANLSAVVGEAIPFWGIGVIITATGFELKLACDNAKDLYELQVMLDPESAIPDERNEVCGLQVPTRGEIWATIKASPSQAWQASVSGANGTVEWAKSLEAPDFSAGFETLLSWFPDFD